MDKPVDLNEKAVRTAAVCGSGPLLIRLIGLSPNINRRSVQ